MSTDGTITTEGVRAPVDPPSHWISPDGADVDADAWKRGPKVHPGTRAMLARIASGERNVPHLIATVRWGPDRLTTCDACDFTATGRTDEEMKIAWDRHSYTMKHRSGPVEIIVEAS